MTEHPHSEEAEISVIGSIIIDPQKVLNLCADNEITANSFFIPAHRHLFLAVQVMERESRPIDLVTVGHYLTEEGQIHSVGGWEYLEKLVEETPTAAHAEYYIGIVKEKELLRAVIHVASEAIDKCSESEAKDVVASLSENLTQIVSHKEEKSTADCMDDNIHVLDNAYNGIVSGIPLPWDRFSNSTSGLQRGSVIPFVGRDGKGKSGALAQCLDFWAGERIPTLAISLEDVKRRTLLRMAGCREWFSARSAETGRVLLNGRYEKICQHEWSELRKKMFAYKEFIDEAPFWIMDNPMNIEEICYWIKHYRRVHGVQIVTIDGFKDIIFTEGKSRTEKEAHVAKLLQAVAKETDVAMPVVSHINKIHEDVPITKIDVTGAGEQMKGARQVIIFQDAGLPEIVDEHHFVLSMTKSNFGGGGYTVLRRDEGVLHYTEV
ncbi:MAG: hypothetical protein H8E10_10665 [Desulfobacterales bacterium]|nr:hypothetical protein [Desulfobacterales bacterium]